MQPYSQEQFNRYWEMYFNLLDYVRYGRLHTPTMESDDVISKDTPIEAARFRTMLNSYISFGYPIDFSLPVTEGVYNDISKYRWWNDKGDTLMWRLIEYDVSRRTGILDILLNAGADVNAKNRHGKTMLYQAAAIYRNIKMAEYLIRRGADINAVKNNGETAFSATAKVYINTSNSFTERNAKDVLAVLLKYGAKPYLSCSWSNEPKVWESPLSTEKRLGLIREVEAFVIKEQITPESTAEFEYEI